MRIALLRKRDLEPDNLVASALEQDLRHRGHEVFVDRRTAKGLAWAQTLEPQLRQADLVIPILSPGAVTSEMLAYEIEMADEASRTQSGRPRLLPIRVGFKGPFPEPIGAFLNPVEFQWDTETERHRPNRIEWFHSADTPALLARVSQAVDETAGQPPAAQHGLPRVQHDIEPPGGAMPIESHFYIARPADTEFLEALDQRHNLILLKGARQVGKTSLLGRALDHARNSGLRVLLTDLQKLQATDLTQIDRFYQALADQIAFRLAIEPPPPEAWSGSHSPNTVFEGFWRRKVLTPDAPPLFWACDEFDRLFSTPFGTEVCALVRSWHNDRSFDPAGPWHRLTLAIAYATEAQLFITDLNQSPFNVGLRIALENFTLPELARLNQRYGSPLHSPQQEQQFLDLCGGQPFLSQCGLQNLVRTGCSLDELAQHAAADDGVFGDHLRRLLVVLSRDSELLQTVASLLKGPAAIEPNSFFRLRSAGLVRGPSPSHAALACTLYQHFFQTHL